MDICILTFNRLPYLQKCIWSLLAGTAGRHRFIVLDDGSTDGSREWLLHMRSRGVGIELIFPKVKLGTANGFNKLAGAVRGEWLVFCNDDMWFHRDWLDIGVAITKKYDDCGMVSLYDYTVMQEKNIIARYDDCLKLWVTGLGATLMYMPLWQAVGGFHLPVGRVMGFFASNFCKATKKVGLVRNQLYMPIRPYVHNMDLVNSKLSERAVLGDYIQYRQQHKK